MVLVCRIDDVSKERVDLKTNKELVSFVHTGFVYKVQVDEVISIMSASFDNVLENSDIHLCQTGGQNKTFAC